MWQIWQYISKYFFLKRGQKLCPIPLIKKEKFYRKDDYNPNPQNNKDYSRGIKLPIHLSPARIQSFASPLILWRMTDSGACLLLKTRPFLSFQISQEKRRAREAKSLRLDINATMNGE
jgi:hypothetical protein